MACEGKKYHGVTELIMAGIRLDLREMGLPATEANIGKIVNEQYGVEVEYLYHEAEMSLYVKILSKPFYIPCSFIYNRLDLAIERRQSGHDPMADK